METIVTSLATAFVMLGIFGIHEVYQRKKREIAALQAENQKLKEASRKHLPYQTLEDLEHAKAAWILLMNELEIKETIAQNLGTFLDRARADKREVGRGDPAPTK